MVIQKAYPGYTLEYLLLECTYMQLIDMFCLCGQDYKNWVMKKVASKKDAYGNFTLPGVNVVKPKKEITWKRV